MLKQLIKRGFRRAGYNLERLPVQAAVYDQDGLWTVHNHEFMQDPRFHAAYQRGLDAALGLDYLGPWRLHIALWAASSAARLRGDFVECGVNRGVVSSAIMRYLDWDALGRTFYLLDTFAGLELELLTAGERARGAVATNREFLGTGRYVTGVESVRQNFAEWKNVRIVQGTIPGTLPEVDAKELAYLHLDMNCTRPETDALRYFWDRLVPGALILLDDYAYDGYRESKLGMDELAREMGFGIASLPTGQGLIVKPPR
ncbi:MAG TPA: TylF/MycF/NovP-related O-methyltransferase [Polyangiaceae bacterium]|jgi:hypothetical protein|nr:TylF/MycF/NovP-related O-methyltransferase [Polyangiaceae bacterium]